MRVECNRLVSCSGEPRPKDVRIGKPVIQPDVCTTPDALESMPRGSPEKRVVLLRSRIRPCSISIDRLSSESPPQTATPKRAFLRTSTNSSSLRRTLLVQLTGLLAAWARKAASVVCRFEESRDLIVRPCAIAPRPG